MKRGAISLAVFACLCLIAQDAYAYLDLGTGSYMLQLLIAFFLGGLFTVKLFWTKIKTFLRNLFFRQT